MVIWQYTNPFPIALRWYEETGHCVCCGDKAGHRVSIPLIKFTEVTCHRCLWWLLEEIAEKKGIPFVDLYSPLADPATGSLLAKFSSDGVHLKQEGYYEMGRVIYEDLFVKKGLA